MVHGPSQAVFGLGAENQAADIVAVEGDITAAVATHAAVAAAAGTHGRVKQVLANGTAAATDVTVTGMVAADVLISVFSFTTAASIASVANRTAEYTPQAGGLDKAAGTDETNNQLLITYIDVA
jgi:hypothetical protein